MFTTIIAFILVLGILVLVHELGHFITAKLAGIKVEEFSIGFPPRIFSFKKGETKYTIGALPIGGYVKMLGEDEKSSDKRAFNNQTPLKRFIVSIAGVVMNIALAWIILSIGFAVGMTPMATPSEQIPGEVIKSQVFIASVNDDSAAKKGGVEPGDQIIRADSTEIKDTDDLTTFTSKNQGKEVNFTLIRNNEEISKKVTLGSSDDAPLGVGIVDQGVVRVQWYKAPVVALKESYEITKLTFDFFGQFITKLFRSGQISDEVGGPVAIFNMTGMAAKAGIIVLLQFMALLSINLAIINILPFPALDGGRALFILVEKIAGKKVVKEEIEGIIHLVGFALLILLIVAITYKDIVRLFK